jgi:putative transposase
MKLKAYKFRIYPNKEQENLLNKTFGCVRYFYNSQVAMFNTYNKETNPKPIFKTSTELRNEVEWMQEVSAAAIQQKEIDFKEFKNQLFNIKRKTKLGFPKFKKKSNNQSYRLPNQKFKIVNGKLQLEKIGKVKFVQDRDFPEFFKFLNVTISKNCSGQYFASILVEQEINHKTKTGKECGTECKI